VFIRGSKNPCFVIGSLDNGNYEKTRREIIQDLRRAGIESPDPFTCGIISVPSCLPAERLKMTLEYFDRITQGHGGIILPNAIK
jgi:hypothetical protein